MKVLTIAGCFPSLIQPWLVAQLVQIIKNGGDNFVLAPRSEQGIYTSDIATYQLDEIYQVIPDDNSALLKNVIVSLLSVASYPAVLRGLSRWLRLLLDRDLTLKEKLFSLLLIKYLGINDVTIIHSHSEPAGSKFFPIVKALGVPLVVTFHGLPPLGVQPITDAQRKRYTKLASVILVNTQFAKKQYVALGAPEHKVRILPQGIHLSDFTATKKESLGVAKHTILTVGRFHPDKGQAYSLQAIKQLLASGYNINYRLVGSGPEEGRLRAMAKQLDIENSVEFYTKISDEMLRELYTSSDIFILPSLRSEDGFHEETQGVVLQEAQASGLIVVATKVGGIPECIEDAVTGFLVEDRSVEAIEKTIEQVITAKSRWPDIQQAARTRLERDYDIEKIGKKVQLIYREILGDTRN